MPIRIIHTADNHLGLPFKQFPTAAARLIEERFLSLERLVAIANDRNAHFFVVAGDLFDSTRVKAGDIDRAAAVLRGFDGVAVIVLSDNHDHHASSETEGWKLFRRATEADARIDLLVESAVKSYDVEGQTVHFFPCACPRSPPRRRCRRRHARLREWRVLDRRQRLDHAPRPRRAELFSESRTPAAVLRPAAIRA